MKTSYRNARLDFLRFFAIVSVVVCHATEAVYYWDINFINALSVQSKVFVFSAFTFGRLGVPIFMFLTGYFLLSRNYDSDGIKSFYKNHLLQLIITSEIWIILYDIFLSFFTGENFEWNILIKNILFLEHVKMGNMWYIPMILGIYIFIPFIAMMLKQFEIKYVLFPYIVSFIYITVVPVINDLLKAFCLTGIVPALSLEFSGGAYGLTLFAGYFFKRYFDDLTKLSKYSLAFVCIATYVMTVSLQIFYYGRNLRYNVWYNWCLLLICAASLTLLLVKFASRFVSKNNEVFIYLGNRALGVFFVHFPLLMLLNNFLPSFLPSFLLLRLPLRVIMLSISALVGSYLIIHLVAQIKCLRKMLFYIK